MKKRIMGMAILSWTLASAGCTIILEIDDPFGLVHGALGGGGSGGAGGAIPQCITPPDCPGADDECQRRVCIAGACMVEFVAADVAIPSQNAGDCNVTVCDGNGSKMQKIDDTDFTDDSNACTDDLCVMGELQHTIKATGAECGTTGNGAPLICDASGQCTGCDVSSDCPPPVVDPACKSRTCTSLVCGIEFVTAGTTCGDGLVCDGSGGCKKTNGTACNLDNECVNGHCADGVCCNTACTDGSCNAAGECKLDIGKICAGNDACASNMCVDDVCCSSSCTSPCQSCALASSIGTCANIPFGQEDYVPANVCVGLFTCNGGGACLKDDGQTCGVNNECLNGNCVDGVCCNTSCGGSNSDCQACNLGGSMGVCSPIPSGQICRPVAGGCDVTETCNGVSTSCPTDSYQPSSSECRSAASSCDVAETCTGASPSCPADVKAVSGTICSALSCSGNTLNYADMCDGAGTCIDGGTQVCSGVCYGNACHTCDPMAPPQSCTYNTVACTCPITCAPVLRGEELSNAVNPLSDVPTCPVPVSSIPCDGFRSCKLDGSGWYPCSDGCF